MYTSGEPRPNYMEPGVYGSTSIEAKSITVEGGVRAYVTVLLPRKENIETEVAPNFT